MKLRFYEHQIVVPEGTYHGRVLSVRMTTNGNTVIVEILVEGFTQPILLYFSITNGVFTNYAAYKAYCRLCTIFNVTTDDTELLRFAEGDFELRHRQGNSRVFYEVYPAEQSTDDIIANSINIEYEDCEEKFINYERDDDDNDDE